MSAEELGRRLLGEVRVVSVDEVSLVTGFDIGPRMRYSSA